MVRAKEMKCFKLLFIVLLWGSACTSYVANKESSIPPPDDLGLTKGLQPVSVIDGEGWGTSPLSFPTGITLDFMGNIFITDTGNNRVVECDPEGGFLREIGGFGWETGQFNHPTYLTTDNGLNIYVVDSQNKRIQRLDHNLNFVAAINIEKSGDFTGLGLPEGIAITPSGEMILSDMQEDCLILLDNGFNYERSVGGFGGGGGNLRDPLGICLDRDGNIFVADSHDNRVAVFDRFGNFLKGFGEKYLNLPSGVAVDQNQLTFVANTGNNSITVFDRQGDWLLDYGGLGGGYSKLSRPTDVKFGTNGKLYVVDSGNNRVMVLDVIR
jgi:tripartite motif-containing protein 71